MTDIDQLAADADLHRKARTENGPGDADADAPLVRALLTGETDPRLTTRPTARTRAVIEDAQFMADTGETLTGAARRLGLSVNGLEQTLRRHGHTHITRTLRNNQTDKDPS